VEAVNHHIHNPLFETIKATAATSCLPSSSSLTSAPAPAASQQQVRVSCVPSIDTTQSHEFMDENGLLWMVASAEINSEHVIGRAIVRYATSNPNLPPLESSVDMNATTGRGIKCMVKGYEVLVGSLKYLREEGVEHSQNSTFQNMSIAAEEVGSIVVFAAINGSMRAMIQLTDKPRPEAYATIRRLQEMGKKVWMVTGDNIRTARSIASAVGIPPMQVISEALPSTKIQHVTNLQEEGEFVGFVGDGINGTPYPSSTSSSTLLLPLLGLTPALSCCLSSLCCRCSCRYSTFFSPPLNPCSIVVAKADVGIAMGGGTDVAMESADMVLMRADVFSVVVAIDLSRAILQCIRRNLFWALAYNVVAIPIAAGLSLAIFQTIIPPWVAGGAMALSSVSVVLSSLSLLNYQPPLKHTLSSSSSSSSPLNILTRSSSKSPPTTTESPLPSRLTSFGEKLLSFADGFEYLEMDEGKTLIDDKDPKRLYGSDNRV
jgi:P-type Cu+ transporter